MSGINKWVPFFEEASESRDVESWWEELTPKVLSWGMEIIGVVSDRAKALVKLGEEKYLNVWSMPDLFHFMQDISKAVGMKVGRKLERAKKAVGQANQSGREQAQAIFKELSQVYHSYREQIEGVNKMVHPFNEQDEWTNAQAIEKGLLHCFTSIGKIAQQLGIDIAIDKAQKILDQIEPIAQGIGNWIKLSLGDLDEWQAQQLISIQEKKWLITYAIPYVYWQIQLRRTQAKARNQDLRTYYKQRVNQAAEKWKNSNLITQLTQERLANLMDMAYQFAINFQRSSSQTEGRNGYLAFVNHAHRGIPKERLKALTVIHNYDIRRTDGSTPAQRLFGRDFPDLFEFICQNVTGFKEPKCRKSKVLNASILQL